MRANILVVTVFLASLWAPVALAGGYDTPILYSARHMGMGGTAVSYVSDPSALFHNPAGLGKIKGISVLGDFSLLVGGIQGSPSALASANSIDSNTTVAPFFLVGGGIRITDWLAAGLAVYPVASAGATYEYPGAGGTTVEDHTQLVFLEISPGVAFVLPYNLRLGVGYRITYTSLTRTVAPAGTTPIIDFTLTGTNFASFRAGLQWDALSEGTSDIDRRDLSFGLNYRHKTVVDVGADEGIALAQTGTDLKSDFTLPARLVFGVRGDYDRIGGAVDLEYGFNSQNERTTVSGDTAGGTRISVNNVFAWSDAITLRGGLEYRWLDAGEFATRLGYVFDGTTANPQYPTAFGTPPTPTHSLTAGIGYDGGPWETNLAYAYRFGSTTVTEGGTGAEVCQLCSANGDYAIGLHGLYVDVSYDF
ncbi:MAG: outer membrane protein transport protein [Myxococcales bacterium]|nr:outer membrane protein transport protein [Myxococcales bacterium]